MTLSKGRPVQKHSVKYSSDVRYSNRGYAYAELGNSAIIGLVPTFETHERPDLKDTPRGVLIYNKTNNCLEISDPENNAWISICTGSGTDCSGGCTLGYPTDGTYEDGPVEINPSGSIADAIDDINEYLFSSGLIELASHLGTQDGNTNGILVDPMFTIGRVAGPATPGNPYYTNSWDNDVNRDLTNLSALTWQLAASQSITDLQGGTITLSIYGGNGLISSETLAPDGSLNPQVSSPDGLVSISSLVPKGNKVEGYLSIYVPVSLLLSSNSGYLRVEVEHVVNGNTYANTPLEFFRDSAGAPSVDTQSISLYSSPEKFLSGVRLATISGASFPVLQIQMYSSNMWSDTYRADLLGVNAGQFGIPNYVVNYNSSAISKDGIAPPSIPFIHDQDFAYNELKSISSGAVTNPNGSGDYAQMNFSVRDPFNTHNSSLFYSNPPILINTYGNVSNDTTEYFLDENYRLELTSSGSLGMTAIYGSGRGADAWDSEVYLTVRSGLQVINGALIYPQEDWSSFSPSPNPDYTSLAAGIGDLQYVRRFRDSNGLGRTNGVLRIQGLSESDRLNELITIELRVVGAHIAGNPVQGPGNEGTGWLSLNKPYNLATFNGDDGDGCFVNAGGYTAPDFEFSLGGFSTAYSSNEAIEVRVTFKDPDALGKRISVLQVVNWG